MPVLPSYRNQSIDLHSKPIDRFLYEGNTGTYGLMRHWTEIWGLYCLWKALRIVKIVCCKQYVGLKTKWTITKVTQNDEIWQLTLLEICGHVVQSHKTLKFCLKLRKPITKLNVKRVFFKILWNFVCGESYQVIKCPVIFPHDFSIELVVIIDSQMIFKMPGGNEKVTHTWTNL